MTFNFLTGVDVATDTKHKKTKEVAAAPTTRANKVTVDKTPASTDQTVPEAARVDTRFKFKRSVNGGGGDGGGGDLTLTFTCRGGPTALIQVSVCDANDKLMSSVGFAGDAAPLSTAAQAGPVDWRVDTQGCRGGFVKMIYVVLRGAGTSVYHVTTQVWQGGKMLMEADVIDAIPEGNSVAPAFADGFNID